MASKAFWATDDAGWETVAVIVRNRFVHHATLRDQLRNLAKLYYSLRLDSSTIIAVLTKMRNKPYNGSR